MVLRVTVPGRASNGLDVPGWGAGLGLRAAVWRGFAGRRRGRVAPAVAGRRGRRGRSGWRWERVEVPIVEQGRRIAQARAGVGAEQLDALLGADDTWTVG